MKLLHQKNYQTDKTHDFVIYLDFEPIVYLSLHDYYAGENLIYNLFAICAIHFELGTVLGYKIDNGKFYLSRNELYVLDKTFKTLNLDQFKG